MKDKTTIRSPWYIEPYEGESVSHYFGRLKRAEIFSINRKFLLSKTMGLGYVLPYWERFLFNPRPNHRHFQKISRFTGLTIDKVEALFPAQDANTVHRSTRMCCACYREAPYHRMEWQYESTAGCDKHQLRLLSRCPSCDEKFAYPSEWDVGACKRCGMKFTSMIKRQKKYD